MNCQQDYTGYDIFKVNCQQDISSYPAILFRLAYHCTQAKHKL